MSLEPHEQVRKIFEEALDRAETERLPFVESACSGDMEIFQTVMRLLKAHDEAGSFLKNECYARQVIGRYLVTGELGRGATGIVYEAVDPLIGRSVAVKTIHLQSLTGARDAAFLREQLFREARSAGGLFHQGIVIIFDVGRVDDVAFIAMERVEGPTLQQMLVAGPKLDQARALDILRQTAEALDYAHRNGVVHRDIKPANIMLHRSMTVKITDFGIAKITTAERQTVTGVLMGTPCYMSPEQIELKPLDGRSDQFSLAVVAYETLTGTRPFEADSLPALAHLIAYGDRPSARTANPALPPAVDGVLRRGLEKLPEKRYASCSEFVEALDAAFQGASEPQVQPAKSASLVSSAEQFVSPRLELHETGMGGDGEKLQSGSRLPAPPSRRPVDSIAVIPFKSKSSDPGAEYLSDGITGTIITSLSSIRKLRVMAQSTVERYKGALADPLRVGRELNVSAVLTGHVLQVGNTLVIGAELVDTTDGSQIWGQKYNRELRDIFQIQEEISREISEKLHLKLSSEEWQCVAKRPTENSHAYQLYLRGRYHWNKRTAKGLNAAIGYFHKAIEQDPGYALAYTGLSDSYSLLAFHDLSSPIAVMPKAARAAATAFEMDPLLAEAHASMGMLAGICDFDWPESVKELKRAIELKPGYASAHHWYAACLSALGEAESAERAARRALELDPLSPGINVDLAKILFRSRKFDEAMKHCFEMLALGGELAGPAHHVLGCCHQQQKRYQEAIREFRQALSISESSMCYAAYLGHSLGVAGHTAEARGVLDELFKRMNLQYVPPYYIALIHLGLGEIDHTLEYLRRAFDDRYPQVVYLNVNPIFDTLRLDPRFANLLRRTGTV